MAQNPQKTPLPGLMATAPAGVLAPELTTLEDRHLQSENAALNPISTDAALLLIKQGEYEIAARVLVQVRDAEPDNAQVYHCLGLLLTEQGNLPNAIDAWQAATAIDPGHKAAWLQLILALLKTDRLKEAHQACISAHGQFADDPLVWMASSEVLNRIGNVSAAAESMERVAHLAPGDANVHCRLGELLLKCDRVEDALAQSTKAFELAPDHPAVLRQHLTALRKNGKSNDLIQLLTDAVEQNPDAPAVQHELCLELERQDGKERAAEQAQMALELFPDDGRIISMLGRLLRVLGRWSDLSNLVDDRLGKDPNDPLGLSLQASLRQNDGRLAEAETLYRRALEGQPDNPTFNSALGVLLLSQGQYDEGWRLYGSRIHTEASPIDPIPPLLLWDGRMDRNIDLMVMDEQGLGDTIQFARFLPLARERVRSLRVIADRKLARLLAPLDQGFADCAAAQGIPTGEKDSWRWIPIMSLAQALQVDERDFAAPVPYLSAEPTLVDHWNPKIAKKGLRIGIAWQGNPESGAEAGRSLPLSAYAPIAGLDGVHLYSLQKFHGTEQLETVDFRDRITTFGDAFDAGDDAFVDTAAVMANLDLIITSDTAIAHLAGALGRPVWVALSKRAEWRWKHDQEDSPWYPTMTLFRQDARGDWSSVMNRMASQIRAGLIKETQPKAKPSRAMKETG